MDLIDDIVEVANNGTIALFTVGEVLQRTVAPALVAMTKFNGVERSWF